MKPEQALQKLRELDAQIIPGPSLFREMAESVGQVIQENQRIKGLLAEAIVEAQRFQIWYLGNRKESLSMEFVPPMRDLPDDVQESVRKMRDEKYGIR